MTRLTNISSVGMQIWDYHPIVNPRSLVPGFNKLPIKSRFGSCSNTFAFDDAEKRFIPTPQALLCTMIDPKPSYRLMQHVLNISNQVPKHGDIIEFRMQRRIISPLQQEHNFRNRSNLEVCSDTFAIACVSASNLQSNVYEISRGHEKALQELSPGFLFVIANSMNTSIAPSQPKVIDVIQEGYEDSIIISYFKVKCPSDAEQVHEPL
jgi:hypothetical protein